MEILQILKKAIVEKKQLEIDYNDTKRLINPYILYRNSSNVYLDCVQMQENNESFKKFKLDAISNLKVLETSFSNVNEKYVSDSNVYHDAIERI